jgi:hypothetical protein
VDLNSNMVVKGDSAREAGQALEMGQVEQNA